MLDPSPKVCKLLNTDNYRFNINQTCSMIPLEKQNLMSAKEYINETPEPSSHKAIVKEFQISKE
jgi:hypothetical protein